MYIYLFGVYIFICNSCITLDSFFYYDRVIQIFLQNGLLNILLLL